MVPLSVASQVPRNTGLCLALWLASFASPCVGGADAGGEPGLGKDGLPDAPCRGSGGISLSWENGEGLVDGVFLDVRGEAHEDLHHAV